MAKTVDRLYPLKSTCLYVAVALLADIWALLQRSFPPSDKTLLWSGGGIFVYVPWGRPAIALSALLGLGTGAAVAVAVSLFLFRHFRVLARQLASGEWWCESALLVTWLLSSGCAYYLGEELLFPKLSGPLAAMNVFAARAIIYPALAAIYEAAAEQQAEGLAELDIEWRAAA
ncbi:MAG: hypothetical protein N2512_02285 [Armatimonadetes bacterium]|nr:hypothetical protein [Armatimonadota bacterium]